MPDPFRIELSSNVQKFVFSETWDYSRDYHMVFNALDDVMQSHLAKDKPWGMIGDWRRWLVQTPESERVCVRSLSELCCEGMTHYVSVVEEHPIAQWQQEKVAQANPRLKTASCPTFEEAEAWLQGHGLDTNFQLLPFSTRWYEPSERFENALNKLNLDPHKFKTA